MSGNKTTQGSKSYIGLRDLVYAKLLEDVKGSLPVYGPVKSLAPAKTASINPNSSSSTEYADDGILDVFDSNGAYTVSFTTAGIDDEVLADLLGAKYEDGGTEYHKDRRSPFVAVGYKSKKADGTFAYMWLLKGKFNNINREHNTQEDSITPQGNTLEGTFIDRDSDGLFKHVLNTAKAPEETIENYFKNVYGAATESDEDTTP
ncbi:major tail protein [Shouchella clausii]|uniref:major tail protein n=1 Tax=Shouchella clausii TaxID=79880 RepID=UPI0012FD72BA|nr:major tail protein [Shouchella clausii]MCR1287851.1 hypothetical protein [Shouchella clausii]MCY1106447.1 hypothetical protein [Shouchella clausii]MEB5473197.1 phage tail protein [Shouchella clausii]WQG93481.1 major tail protein [Shouchella clausii]